MRDRILKAIGREIPFEDNLSMRKGKELENLGFREFVRMHEGNIEVLHKTNMQTVLTNIIISKNLRAVRH
ncbi:hypothetical protein BHY_1506 (plasmid) [Borrelia nietonii YOR]|uniref:Uncharacterized protein n=1 Tax=Borrelia nietonii YOR TaxID=1293576 RepID=W5SH89_9SPIR|nr:MULTISPECIES: hypothetical protein [Borrelia]AHH04456.1 hypothetical protein BHY_1506 [Borrelia nietonii YOR]AHH14358.1 hypothetical protein BHW_0116200 [Borrelia hermsii MTW]UPA10120.1 hypothetical protein bhYOR_001509 [Borrelia nietonii YOR]